MLIRGLALALLAVAPALAQEPEVVLKPGPGHDTVAQRCSVCHSLDYIRMNSPFLTQAGWTAEVKKMRNVFGAPIDDAMEAEIITYLSKEYAAPPGG